MNIRDLFNNENYVKSILSSIKLSIGEFFTLRHILDYSGLYASRSSFYGTNYNNDLVVLDREKTSFNSSTDIPIHIEGIVVLKSIPVNTGSGDIVYSGYGVLEVNNVVIYDGRTLGNSILVERLDPETPTEIDNQQYIEVVVNGVKSWVPAVYVSGTPQEVKDLLLADATGDWVDGRYQNDGESGPITGTKGGEVFYAVDASSNRYRYECLQDNIWDRVLVAEIETP